MTKTFIYDMIFIKTKEDFANEKQNKETTVACNNDVRDSGIYCAGSDTGSGKIECIKRNNFHRKKLDGKNNRN